MPEVIEDFFVQAAPIVRHPAQVKSREDGPRLRTRPRSAPALAHRRTPRTPLRQTRPRIQEHRVRQAIPARTPPWNGSPPAIRCSRPSARTCCENAAPTSSAAASFTICTPALPTASISSPPPSKTDATTSSTAACSPSRPSHSRRQMSLQPAHHPPRSGRCRSHSRSAVPRRRRLARPRRRRAVPDSHRPQSHAGRGHRPARRAKRKPSPGISKSASTS